MLSLTRSNASPGLSSALMPRFSPFSAVKVTLDPNMAHPQLVLSEDRRSVARAETWQQLPNNAERFDAKCFVLGCGGFTSGRQCWEVEVGEGGYWAVAVTRESVKRKGWIYISSKGGIWAVRHWQDRYEALTAPHRTHLSLSAVPQRLQVYLDCAGGRFGFSMLTPRPRSSPSCQPRSPGTASSPGSSL